VTIDPDINFGVVAWVEVFGFQAMVGIRRKRIAGRAQLSDEDTHDPGVEGPPEEEAG
jgi:hypothetical protein